MEFFASQCRFWQFSIKLAQITKSMQVFSFHVSALQIATGIIFRILSCHHLLNLSYNLLLLRYKCSMQDIPGIHYFELYFSLWTRTNTICDPIRIGNALVLWVGIWWILKMVVARKTGAAVSNFLLPFQQWKKWPFLIAKLSQKAIKWPRSK